LLKRLSKIDVLIIDALDVGLMTEDVRRDFLEVLEDRHGLHSTVITSQLPIEEWHSEDIYDHSILNMPMKQAP